ncbi:cytochrome c-type biogenesis protein [Xanthomonas fragariae]|uniref:Cytochrome c-type biogenesis protein n=1 Tax=Xanthomonas fragariae TaxID=48664 RepID=A0A1Y6H7E7_9XANT|nr:cytochrome c-type biogenesis protein [Xanthomonas fragariae]AOD14794.1 cytochrome C biogenesis protein [Xanthomonas fragariae]AOD18188.1 cytochrome C biogenesis protein [Xanthomonas fragariae]ENZ95412.1 C-type cytochrome biogenesis protein [Xanthomonas fragariae LMG 25863]MBL9195798.1 cytochrome c-type biogenesis protein CcmH [Xanthomonas fragariae]MBL9220693.1 cytochrome c-type biogenesis protein CcmH [Xanthomonas fragariae]
MPWRRQLRLIVLLLLGVLFAPPLAAQAVAQLPFKNRSDEARYQRLTVQPRCLVCQNENLADSKAEPSRDLRHQVFAQLQAGNSDTQIKQYMVDRYSDFVLYDPPVKRGTWLLWFGPLLVLGAGAGVVIHTGRKRACAGTPVAPQAEEQW